VSDLNLVASRTRNAFNFHGDNLAIALRSGIHRVIGEQDLLNRINVFPVADGDTGTNLCLSLGAALETLSRPGTKHLGNLLAQFADALLDGARGNSGAIVAQFFQGMSDSAQDLARFSTASFAKAVATGSDYAHDALSNPREGTILSVIAEFSASLRHQVAGDANVSIAPALQTAINATKGALARTEGQLEELRKAGVVDAGAKGFVTLVEGMIEFIVAGTVADKPGNTDTFVSAPMETAGVNGSLDYRYCTECIVTGSDIDRRKLREQLSELGDSLVLAGTKKKAKIHIHVNEPERVFELARLYGTLVGEKADDMQRQQHSTHNIRGRFAVITDSAADISDADMEMLDIHMVPMRIQFGERGYLDKVSISTEEFFKQLAENPAHPTTSQPSPGDFRRHYEYLGSHFPDVISISLTPKVSGTYQAAVSAASRIGATGRVHVVNSLNASLGQGQLAVFAAECAVAGLDAETTLNALQELIPVTQSFALIRDLRFAVRGGRVPKSKKLLADVLRVTPVLRTLADGTIRASGILPGRHKLLPKFARLIARSSNEKAALRLAIGHALCKADAHQLAGELENYLPNIVKTTITELGSALGVHGGPGSLVVGVQEYRPPEDFRTREIQT
jgi:DegV family protein with EDD domain